MRGKSVRLGLAMAELSEKQFSFISVADRGYRDLGREPSNFDFLQM
jgi:hypothetical protein